MFHNNKLTIIEHLDELRSSCIRILFVIGFFTCIILYKKNILFDLVIFGPAKSNFISYRYFNKVSYLFSVDILNIKNLHIQNRSMFGQFNSYIKCSFYGGVICSTPYIFYEIWSYIKKGLRIHEIFILKRIFLLSIFLFVLGVLFGYFILCPVIIQFSVNFCVSAIPINVFDLTGYVSMIIQSVFSMGLIFLFPIVVYFLSMCNILPIHVLTNYRKHVILCLLILSAAVTPTDIVSTIITFVPLYILYELTIYIIKFLKLL
jgi:sec-independent protein translocase protein TatC